MIFPFPNPSKCASKPFRLLSKTKMSSLSLPANLSAVCTVFGILCFLHNLSILQRCLVPANCELLHNTK
uniref:Uncharacterized protein n=1 Tax=Rhizophora mucronata TaxID=61149 RepID=A0A2P2IVQ9_RHIMU